MELREIAPDVYACLQEDRGLGCSNSGLVAPGTGLVVDTFWDLPHTREMIDLYDAPTDGEARQLELLIGRIEARRRELLQKRDDIDLTLGELKVVESGCHARLEELAGRAGGTGTETAGRR